MHTEATNAVRLCFTRYICWVKEQAFTITYCIDCALKKDELTYVVKLPGAQTHRDCLLAVFIDGRIIRKTAITERVNPMSNSTHSTMPAKKKVAPR